MLESALYVCDLDAAEAFYRDVLGLDPITRVEGRHAFFRCGEGVGRAPARMHRPVPLPLGGRG